MLSRQAMPPSKGVQGSSFASSASSVRSVQPLRKTKDTAASSDQGRDPHRCIQAGAQPGKGSSLSPPSKPQQTRITSNPTGATIKPKPFAQALSAAESLVRGGPLAYTPNPEWASRQPDDDDVHGPLDSELRAFISGHAVRDGPGGYLFVLRATLLGYTRLASGGDTGEGTDAYDAHIAQLGRVLDELTARGHCVIAGKIVRPR